MHAELLLQRVRALRDNRVWQQLGYASWEQLAEAELGASPSTQVGVQGVAPASNGARSSGPGRPQAT